MDLFDGGWKNVFDLAGGNLFQPTIVTLIMENERVSSKRQQQQKKINLQKK